MFLLLALVLLSSCLRLSAPPEERPPRTADRLVKASFAEIWAATRQVLEQENLPVTEDEKEGVLTSHLVRRAKLRDQDFGKELLRIADLDEGRRHGMRGVDEYTIDYHIQIVNLDEDQSKLTIAAKIVAVDRSEVVYMGFGVLQVIPRYFELPSTGASERDLSWKIGHEIFAGEEMLYYMGELGRD